MISHVCKWLLLGIFAGFLLAGCARSVVTVTPAKDVPACLKACDTRLEACSRVCRNNCSNCRKGAYISSAHGFERYLKEQYVKGQMLTRELKSYRDPLQCRKTTCDCQSDHNVCMQSCSGVIQKRLTVAPQCT